MSAVPGPVYGLEVPPGEILIPASMDFPASFRITMAALDPTEEPEADEEGNVPAVPRATLRLVKRAFPGLDDEDDDGEIDDEYMKALLAASDDDEDEDEDDEEANGGPSDPKKAKKQKQAAAIKKLLEATKEDEDEDDEDEDMEDAKPNGVKAKDKKGKAKGKAKATEEDEEADEDEEEEEDDEDDDSDDGADLENFVVCTLDTERNYQQPLDITVNHGEKVFFVVTGTHTVYLTGNYIMDDDEDDYDSEDDEEDYGFDPEELDYAMGEDASDDESDELDDVEDPRVTEVDSDEEEAPKLVETKKGKNKRAAEEADGLDEMIAKAADSKKQQKKLKNNKGEAVAAEESKKDKKVQFAKNLEQGPTGSGKQSGKATTGVKVVQGVTIDDRTIGKGRTVKSGDTVGVRYIGKLANGQQFDANKKGKPFSFKVGKGQVIKGWDIGITGMAIGGERRLTIPAHLGYGSRGMPGIPANSQLTFDVKLLEIK
ncbi:FKBP-type peptidyl-prolyl isomerase, putative [Metarhizium acridum CQMa 102]|uniref:FK506-binding protein n=1 Tax=Metarhizium acridum (strain CQMa 102) TaxID=655827 RepID=E9E2Y9_METAQ|nr:FKBP-type peptidyl-prolyl isomerase, putative [Metarhizium acridum CQMa 102]EFY89805.1 FKBP-type peptidyl-prolyl isomerase, putative [Metarhizium acridum CQMa 102]